VCDDAYPEAPARHLVEDVGVPAVIGFTLSKTATDLASSLFNPRGVLAVALNSSPMLSAIPRSPDGPRMVWRANFSTTASTGAVAAFVSEVLVPKLARSAGEPVRIAILRRDNQNDLAFADRIVSGLRIEGRSVAEKGAELQQYVVGDAPSKQALATLRHKLVDFGPHVIVCALGEDSFEDDLVPQMEREWVAGRPRPFYIGPGGHLMLDGAAPKRFLAQHKDARARMFATDTPATLPANVKLALHYNEAYGASVTPETTLGAPYDAFYLIAYAIAALGDKPVTGPNLARAIPRLIPPGEPIEVSPAAIFDGFKILRSGRNVDLQGTTTSLDFDLETGDPPVDIVILCPKQGRRGEILTAESGVEFKASSRKLHGKLDCP
jgi:hypothetical protein